MDLASTYSSVIIVGSTLIAGFTGFGTSILVLSAIGATINISQVMLLTSGVGIAGIIGMSMV